MKNKLHLITYLTIVLITWLLVPTSSWAQGNGRMSCEECYNQGYDDGYDDAEYDCPCPPLHFQNLGRIYVALALGYNSFLSTQRLHENNELIARLRANAAGFLANIYLGYGLLVYQNFYLGGEGFFGTSNAEGKSTVNTLGSWFHRQVSIGNTYGLALLPGYLIYNTLLYFRLGLLRTAIETKDYSTGALTSNVSETNWQNGVSYGLGFEMPVYKNFTLRAEYNRINYSSFTTAAGTENSPSDNQAILGVQYRFNY